MMMDDGGNHVNSILPFMNVKIDSSGTFFFLPLKENPVCSAVQSEERQRFNPGTVQLLFTGVT